MVQKMKARLKNQKGFSILELIIVVAVIGILVALIFPRIGALTDDARDNADTGNARVLAGATAEAIANADVTLPAAAAGGGVGFNDINMNGAGVDADRTAIWDYAKGTTAPATSNGAGEETLLLEFRQMVISK